MSLDAPAVDERHEAFHRDAKVDFHRICLQKRAQRLCHRRKRNLIKAQLGTGIRSLLIKRPNPVSRWIDNELDRRSVGSRLTAVDEIGRAGCLIRADHGIQRKLSGDIQNPCHRGNARSSARRPLRRCRQILTVRVQAGNDRRLRQGSVRGSGQDIFDQQVTGEIDREEDDQREDRKHQRAFEHGRTGRIFDTR
jgi:hypothetical protein